MSGTSWEGGYLSKKGGCSLTRLQGFTKVRESMLGAGDHAAMLTSAPGPRTMDPKGKKTTVARSRARSRTRSRSRPRFDSKVPWQMELRPRRAISLCVRCHNHGFTDQIKNHMHFCFFQTCKCHKCTFFS